jgi:hypothetical protein
MAAKYILLALLILGNYPLYRLLFRALFAKALAAAGERDQAGPSRDPVDHAQVPGEAREAKKAGLALLFDPEFLRDGGGEVKIFLLLFAAVLAVYAEYSLILGLFPALGGS